MKELSNELQKQLGKLINDNLGLDGKAKVGRLLLSNTVGDTGRFLAFKNQFEQATFVPYWLIQCTCTITVSFVDTD